MQARPPAVQGKSSIRWAWIAFCWGFAEATFFFVVPDVFITRLALRDSLRRALLACVAALVGALLGGALLWSVAARHQTTATLLRNFAHLPGINRDIIAVTGVSLYNEGPKAMFAGGLLGRPYKLFAVHAGAQEIPLAPFLFFSVAARLVRFALTATLAWLIGRGLRRVPAATVLRLHALVWLTFYAAYFFIVR